MEYFEIKKLTLENYPSLIQLLSACNLPIADIAHENQIFYGIIENENIIASIGFEQYGTNGLLRSLAVTENFRGKGLGKLMYNKLNDHCLHAGISRLFLLTTTAEKFFGKLGWTICNRSEASKEIQQSNEFSTICPSTAVCMKYDVFKTHQDYTVQIFDAGFNCAQSVFVPYAIKMGITAEKAFLLSTGFGAGMVYRGETCGAVTGAMMAIGLNYGRCQATDTAARDKTYAFINQFFDKFKQRHGSIICKELLHVDISVPENRPKAFNSGVFDTLCPKFVRDASQIVEELINRGEQH